MGPRAGAWPRVLGVEEQLRPPLGLKHPKATKIGVAKRAAGCYWAVFDCCIQGSE